MYPSFVRRTMRSVRGATSPSAATLAPSRPFCRAASRSSNSPQRAPTYTQYSGAARNAMTKHVMLMPFHAPFLSSAKVEMKKPK